MPAGPFIRGDDLSERAPKGTVTLSSAYAIDRYPVTVRRFLACRAAGVCTDTLAYHEDRLTDPGLLDHAVFGISWEAAAEFCAWDGGRELPTEAQWEKAARGPAPRDDLFVWGDAESCTVFPYELSCPGAPSTLAEEEAVRDRVVGSLPVASGFYADDMALSGEEWVRDYFGYRYYEDPSSEVDPEGPLREESAGTRTVRNNTSLANWPSYGISRRSDRPNASLYTTFRCGRPGF